MKMPILALLGGRKMLAIGLLALAAVLYVGWTQWTIAGLERDVARLQTNLEIARGNLETAQQVNDANRDTLAKLAADARAGEAAHAQALAAAHRRCETATRIRTEIARATTENPSTCPLGGSVRAVLDGLRQPAAGAADRDQDRARDGGPAGGAARLPR
jgi:hypothetical protein